MGNRTDKKEKPQTASTKEPAPTSPDYAICVVPLTAVTSPDHEFSREFGMGALIDLAEEIWPGRVLETDIRTGTFKRITLQEFEQHTKAVVAAAALEQAAIKKASEEK